MEDAEKKRSRTPPSRTKQSHAQRLPATFAVVEDEYNVDLIGASARHLARRQQHQQPQQQAAAARRCSGAVFATVAAVTSPPPASRGRRQEACRTKSRVLLCRAISSTPWTIKPAGRAPIAWSGLRFAHHAALMLAQRASGTLVDGQPSVRHVSSPIHAPLPLRHCRRCRLCCTRRVTRGAVRCHAGGRPGGSVPSHVRRTGGPLTRRTHEATTRATDHKRHDSSAKEE